MTTLLIQDTSVLLNLYASQRAAEIVHATGMVGVICREVVSETLFIRDYETGARTSVDFSSLLATNAFREDQLEGEAELADQIMFAARTGSDADAAVLSMAKHRNAHLACDDRLTRRLFMEFGEESRMWSTPRLVHDWARASRIPEAEIRTLLDRVTKCCRYHPPRRDHLFAWWNGILPG